jgi:phosphoribosyl-ATP pyrophosphohydrolase
VPEAGKDVVDGNMANEAADLLFHVLVALRAAGVELEDVMEELEKRRK